MILYICVAWCLRTLCLMQLLIYFGLDVNRLSKVDCQIDISDHNKKHPIHLRIRTSERASLNYEGEHLSWYTASCVVFTWRDALYIRKAQNVFIGHLTTWPRNPKPGVGPKQFWSSVSPEPVRSRLQRAGLPGTLFPTSGDTRYWKDRKYTSLPACITTSRCCNNYHHTQKMSKANQPMITAIELRQSGPNIAWVRLAEGQKRNGMAFANYTPFLV